MEIIVSHTELRYLERFESYLLIVNLLLVQAVFGNRLVQAFLFLLLLNGLIVFYLILFDQLTRKLTLHVVKLLLLLRLFQFLIIIRRLLVGWLRCLILRLLLIYLFNLIIIVGVGVLEEFALFQNIC